MPDEIDPAQKATTEQQADPYFICDECGEPVVSYKGRFFRTCDHLEADINTTARGMKAIADGL